MRPPTSAKPTVYPVPTPAGKPRKTRRKTGQGLSLAIENTIRKQMLGDRDGWGRPAPDSWDPPLDLAKPKLPAICSATWLDAAFAYELGVTTRGDPITVASYDPKRSDPTYDPHTGRVRDDGGLCRRLPCRCCGVPTPGSGYAPKTVRTTVSCPQCSERNSAARLVCGRCGQALTAGLPATSTCLCRDCAISGLPQENVARGTRDRQEAARLLRDARAIRQQQNAYGASPWRLFTNTLRQSGLILPWDRK